jgi:hypothetical protein
VLEKGYLIAAKNGRPDAQERDRELLTELGREIPEVPREGRRGGRGPGFRLPAHEAARDADAPPAVPRRARRVDPGEHLQETFDEWIGLGTKIINELRLDLSREQDDAVYDYGMRRFLGLTDEKYEG